MKRVQKNRFLSIFKAGGRGIKLLVSGTFLVFWSAILAIVMFPYQLFRVFFPKRKPGRPGGHPVSKFFRIAFENKKAKKMVGVGLTMVVMFLGVMGNILAVDSESETKEEVLIQTPETKVTTTTSLQMPFEGIIGQGYHVFHKAIDILAPIGTEMKPISGGKITEVSLGRLGWGNTVVVEHEDKLSSRYAHLKEIRVIEGETVNKETVLGTVGMTGWTTGPHLHLEIYEDNRPVNPLTILPEYSGKGNK